MGKRTFQCKICRKWFEHDYDGPQVSCCVLHSPGSCCHISDKRIDSPFVQYGKVLNGD